MTLQRISFAVPGDLTTKTGGYIYDRRLIEELRVLGLQVDHIALPDGFPNPTKDQMAQTFAQLFALDKDHPVIIDGLAFGALDPVRVAQIKAPLVALVHHPLAKENGLSDQKAQALYQTERQNLSYVQHVIIPSPHTADILVKEYGLQPEQITLATPGLDRPIGTFERTDPPLILSVGIQLPRKGHDTLLRALAQIADLDWRAVIVGAPLDPAYSQKMQTLRRVLALEERVHFAGLIERADLQRYYQEASIFALATRYEGYGMVFDEALINGLPIVSCATGAVPDTVPQDAGVLVPPDEHGAFGDALQQLLLDSDLRHTMSVAAQTHGSKCQLWRDTAQNVKTALSRIFDNADHKRQAMP